MGEKITRTATSAHIPGESSVLLSVPNPGDEIIRQTHEWFDYQPLNNQEIAATAIFGDHEASIEKEFGYTNGSDGVVLRQKDGEYWIVLYSSVGGAVPAEQKIPQREWNIDRFQVADKDKHYNPSGKKIDFSKFNIVHFDIIWLGGDRSRVAIKYDGIIYDAHEFLNAGKYDRVFMRTGSLPVRYRIKNNGNPAGGSMKQVCYTVRSEGGETKFGLPHVAFIANQSVPQATILANGRPDVTSFRPVLIVKPRALFYGLPNHSKARMIAFELQVKGNTPAFWALIHDFTLLANPTFTRIADESNPLVEIPSMMEWATAILPQNAITFPGHIHNFGMATADVKGELSSGGEIATRIMLHRGTFDHTDDTKADMYAIAVAGDGGVISQVTATLRFTEIY